MNGRKNMSQSEATNISMPNYYCNVSWCFEPTTHENTLRPFPPDWTWDVPNFYCNGHANQILKFLEFLSVEHISRGQGYRSIARAAGYKASFNSPVLRIQPDLYCNLYSYPIETIHNEIWEYLNHRFSGFTFGQDSINPRFIIGQHNKLEQDRNLLTTITTRVERKPYGY